MADTESLVRLLARMRAIIRMRSGYHRTGTGWTARRDGDRITWSRFRRPEPVRYKAI